MSSKTYYQTLQVDPEASVEVIEAAYRRLARIYHPDLNPSSDAVTIMQRINEAYAVLHEPNKRAAYNLTLQRSQTAQTTHPTSTATPRSTTYRSQPQSTERVRSAVPPNFPVQCQACGKSDASLRLAAFPYVVSIVIMTFRRGWSGLYCANCRNQQMLQAKSITFLFGWWGFPFGIIYSLGVLLESDGGKVPPVENAEYLRGLALYFLERGQHEEARKALQASLGYVPDTRVNELYRQLFGSHKQPDTVDAPNTPTGCTTFAVVGGILLLIIFFVAILQGNQASHVAATAPIQRYPEKSSISLSPTPTVFVKSVTPTQTPISDELSDPVLIHSNQENSEITIIYPPTWQLVDEAPGMLMIGGEKVGCQISWKNIDVSAEKLLDVEKLDTNRLNAMRDDQETKTRLALSQFGKIIKFSSKSLSSIGNYKTYTDEYYATVKLNKDALTGYMHYYIVNFICGEKRLCSITYFKFGGSPILTKDHKTIVDLVDSIHFQ